MADDEFVLADPSASGDAPAAEHAADGGASSRPRRRGSLWSGPALWVLVGVVLTLIGSSMAHPIALGSGTGIAYRLSPLDLARPPEVLWEAELSAAQILGTAEGRVVLAVNATGTSRDVVALDLATGDEVWRYRDTSSNCTVGTRVACVAEPGAADATVVLMNVADGAAEVLSMPRALAAVTVDSDVIVAVDTDDWKENIVRLDTDGAELWRATEDAVDDSSGSGGGMMFDHGVLYVGGTMLDPTTGEPTSNPLWSPTPGVWYEVSRRGDGVVIHTPQGDVVVGPDEVTPQVGDDLGGPIAVTLSGDDLVVEARTTGADIWRLAGAAETCRPAGLVNGVLVLSCWDPTLTGTHAFDVLTGGELWQVPQSAWGLTISTDTIVLPQPGTSEVVAVDLFTGQQLWAIPVRMDDGWLDPVDLEDGLLIVTLDGLTRLSFDR